MMTDQATPARLQWRRLWLLVLVACALTCPETGVEALEPRPLCQVCRRYTDTSPSRVVAEMPVGKHSEMIDACSLFCFCERLEDYRRDPLWIRVLDFASRNDEMPNTLSAENAVYVSGIALDLKKAAEPHIVAVPTHKTAERTRQEMGGKIEDWESVFAKCRALAEEWEPEDQNPPPRPEGRRPH